MEEWTQDDIREFGERFASDKIAFTRARYTTPAAQAGELRYWYLVASAFPSSSKYSLPLLSAEINKLEEM